MFNRGSGVLLHITSLPSSYGIGDLGPEAYRFVDFLIRPNSEFWQVLPLNPTDPIYGNSPYSSISAFAGNTLLISPDLLLRKALFPGRILIPFLSFRRIGADFLDVIHYKDKVLETVIRTLPLCARGKDGSALRPFVEKAPMAGGFFSFCCLEKTLDGKVWNLWPGDMRDRDPSLSEGGPQGMWRPNRESEILAIPFP